MWDAESLLPVGEVFVSMSALLRQQENRVSVCREYDVSSRTTSIPGCGRSGLSDTEAGSILGKLMVKCSSNDSVSLNTSPY